MSAPRTPTMDTAQHGQSTVAEELRRVASNTGFAIKLATNRVELPAATPADGPDPYGDPDPEWLRIDWSEHRREIDVDGARVNYA